MQSTEAQINEDFILLFFSKAAEDFFKASVPFASAFFLLLALLRLYQFTGSFDSVGVTYVTLLNVCNNAVKAS